MQWDKFMKVLNAVIMKYYAAMEKGSRMSVLMGDVRRKGKFHSMFTDIVKPGEMEQVIIKAQHNTMSDGRTYGNRGFVPIVHEYIMVLKKLMPYIINFQLPTEHELDIRDSESATWRDVVYAVVKKLGTTNLDAIYNELEGHVKAKKNPNWKAKIRQTLQINKCFASSERGVWAAA